MIISKRTFTEEEIDSCIRNITIGFTNFDKPIIGIENYPCLIASSCNLEKKDFGSRLGQNRIFCDFLPQTLQYTGYSDSRNVQYLIGGNGMFNLKKS